MPTVTVILPTYSRNKSGLLSQAMQSVLDQEYTDFELLVVDDGSTDGSSETIQGFARRDPRVRHIRFDRNVGLPAMTCARAFSESTAPYMAWMFDDCLWRPNHLELLVPIIVNAPDIDVVHAQCEMMLPGERSSLLGSELDVELMQSGTNHIPNCATVVRRTCYERFGWFDPNVLLARYCDWEFWSRIADRAKFRFVPQVVATERGVTLADSLGNTLTVKSDLINKYATTNRTEYLHPENWQNWQPFWLPPELLLSASECADYLEVVTEFLAKHLDRLEDLKIIKTVPQMKPVEELIDNPVRLFAWWADRIKQNMFELQKIIYEKQAYIDEQQAFIDEQQALIHKRGFTIISSVRKFLGI